MQRTTLIVLAAAALAACGPSGKTGQAPARPAAPKVAGPLPALPAWASAYMGRRLSDIGPQSDACLGNTDAVRRVYAGPPAGAAIVGWGFDSHGGQRVDRVLLTDADLRVVGAGEGGRDRPDVPRAQPQIKDPSTGWRALSTATSGPVLAFALIDGGRTICPLGAAEL
jgi:hypothetical protein